jgi:hypothetical protein
MSLAMRVRRIAESYRSHRAFGTMVAVFLLHGEPRGRHAEQER